MKAFVYVTPSHERMLSQFLIPSLPKDLDLIVYRDKQRCKTGNYMSNGFVDSIIERSRWILRMIQANPNEQLLFLDADVQFFTEHISHILKKYLESHNLVSQNDSKYGGGKEYCGGFIAVNSCDEIEVLFAMVIVIMEARKNTNDQIALNLAMKKLKFKGKCLPLDLFWSPRLLWQSDRELNIPSTAIMHHANWCVSLKSKAQQLAKGRAIMNRIKN